MAHGGLRLSDLPRPRYVVPWSVRFLGARRLLQEKPASCSEDMARLLAAAPLPRVDGVEYIPPQGPVLVTTNHYCRPNLGPWWGASLVLTTLARRRKADPAWIVTSEWYYLDWLRSLTVTPVTRWVFGRAARVWGFVPMPPDARELARRAAAVRRALGQARTLFTMGGALGLAPEGQGEDILVEPPRGAGRFLLRLAAGIPILPVGLMEEGGVLLARLRATLHVGPSARRGKARRR